jgi:hypothetical protein
MVNLEQTFDGPVAVAKKLLPMLATQKRRS